MEQAQLGMERFENTSRMLFDMWDLLSEATRQMIATAALGYLPLETRNRLGVKGDRWV
jgi:hypothetical protein